MSLQAGTPIDRYVVEDVLGRGGNAMVYRVKHAVLGTSHALKVLHGERAPGMAERLIHEGQLQAKLDPRVVVPVTDVLTVDGYPALLMPLVQGCSLRDILRRYQPTEEETAYLLLGIARGLEAAHAQDITHRDLKPANVLLEMRHGKLLVRVADFGIARQKQTSLDTNDEGILGTIAYASPEQLEDPTAVDPRADVWSFGVLAYELLVGRRPFQKPHAGALLIQVLSGKYDDTPLPKSWRSEVKTLLAVDLADRLPSVTPMRHALEARSPAHLPVDCGLMQTLRAVMSQAADTKCDTPSPTIVPNLAPTQDQDPSPATAASPRQTNLRPERNAFLGRTQTLERLHRYITAGEPLITLLGLGGMGKTRLAVRYGWQHLDDWAGGVWFCDLADAKSDVGVASAIATTLNVPLGKQSPTVQLGHALAGRGRVLVILDNVEQVVEAVRPMLSAWVERAPEATFIVTSQTRLGLKAEQVMAMPPLDAASAKALFIDRAQRAKSTFTLTDQSEAAIAQLVEQLDRLPLALELAAARVRVMSPEKMLERISQRFRLLASSSGETERHRTLRAALDWSWELLKDWEKSALAQMSVFEGGFDLEAAEAVIDLSDFPDAPWPVDTVQSLVDKSLVRMLVDDRFTLLTSVQAYAADQLNNLGIRNATETRHGAHYAQFGSPEALEALHRHGGLALRRTLKLELDNIAVAWERAFNCSDDVAVIPLVKAAWQTLRMVGPLQTASDMAIRSLSLPNLSDIAKTDLHTIAAGAAWLQGHRDDVRFHIEAAVHLNAQTGHPKQRADLLILSALRGFTEGRHREAIKTYLQVLAILRDLQDAPAEAMVLCNLGIVHHEHGNINESRECYTNSIRLSESIGNDYEASRARGNLALLLFGQGQIDDALRLTTRCIKTFREHGDTRSTAIYLGNFARIHARDTRLDDAHRHYREALAIHRQTGSRTQEAITLFNLSDLHYQTHDLEQSRTVAQQAITVAQEVFPQLVGVIHGTLAKVLARQAAYQQALESIEAGESIMRGWSYKLELAKFIAKKATVYAIVGQIDRARASLEEANKLHAEVGGKDPDILRELAEADAALSPSEAH